MEKISPADLVPLNAFEQNFPINIHLAYADRAYAYNPFKGLYHDEAKIMWAHKDFTPVILLAALVCKKRHNWTLELLDCLRPIEAQEKMAERGFSPMLVSKPGIGGHARAMAVDIWPRDESGISVNMGTSFDFFAKTPADDNPAGRSYTEFDCSEAERKIILENRAALETAMVEAGVAVGQKILPLSAEWWDFRFFPEHFNRFAPLSEIDLEPYQRLVAPDIKIMNEILHGNYTPVMADQIDKISARTNALFEKLFGAA